MTQTSFADRLARLQTQPPASPAASPAAYPVLPRPERPRSERPRSERPGGPGFFATFLIGLLFWPLGFALAFVTGAFLDPEVTRDAVNYRPFLYALGGGHLALLAGGLGAVAARFRHGLLNRVMLMALAGYGMGSAALMLVE